MNNRSSKIIIVALGAGLLASIVGFGGVRLVAPAEAQQAGHAGERWQYGELTIVGNNAVFAMVDRSVYIYGPEKREPQVVEGSRGLKVIQPARLIHLNTLGEEGWEIAYPGGSADSETFLLKRRI